MTPANITAALNWDGKDYILKYRFSLIRELRAVGLNLPGIHRAILADKSAAVDYADDVAEIVAFLLRDAGAKVTGEEVFRACMSDVDRVKQIFQLFNWVCQQHFASSEVAPLPKTQPAAAPGKRRTRSR